MKDKITDAIFRAINSGEVKTNIKRRELKIEKPAIEGHGDYSTNVAMQAFEILRNKKADGSFTGVRKHPSNISGKSPKEFANNIKRILDKDEKLSKYVDKIGVAGPGFINFHLTKKVLVNELSEALRQGDRYGSNNVGKGKTVLVEYSSPNIARHFSIGHLRSTIIGQSIYNLFKHLGYRVIGENHLGDWGTQFGMIIAAVVKNNLEGKKLTVKKYQELYVSYNLLTDNDASAKKEARNWFKKLEDGDKRAKKIWKDAVSISLTEFDRTYKVLGVKIDNAHGESFYEDKISIVIDEFRKRRLTKKSEGAEIVEMKDLVPGILLKSDGGTTYFTRDLAALKYRLETWSPNILVYEVGVEQKLHFKQVFEASRLVGWIKDEGLVHVPHGHYRFKGKKISTRRGGKVILEDILDEAIERAGKILEGTQTAKDLSVAEKVAISKAVGIGAIKYFDLSHRPTSQIDFDWENMFNMQGNSGPYLQYTVARTNSVLRKAQTDYRLQTTAKRKIKAVDGRLKAVDLNKEELALMRAFPQFSEVIVNALKSYSPNFLCNYLFDLAQKYNGFYNSHGILEQRTKNKEQSDFRIALTAATGQILKNGLTLLGIGAPARM